MGGERFIPTSGSGEHSSRSPYSVHHKEKKLDLRYFPNKVQYLKHPAISRLKTCILAVGVRLMWNFKSIEPGEQF